MYKYILKGQAIDKSGIASIKVNGKQVAFSRQGNFAEELQLVNGDNSVTITATDVFENIRLVPK